MKKTSLLYFLYCAGIIFAFIACLIFANFRSEDDSSNAISEVKKDISSEKVDIELNLPNQITLAVGSKAVFLEGYLKVTPANREVFYSISTNQDENGIVFENNSVSAVYMGNYNLTFSVFDNNGFEEKDSVLISVVSPSDSEDIFLINHKTIIGEYYEITEIFNLVNTVNLMRFENLENITLVDNQLLPTRTGLASLTAVFTYDFTEIRYDFNLVVNEIPEYEISIVNFKDKTIDLTFEVGKVYGIQYEISNRNEEEVSQLVLAEIDDESVASIYRISAPIVRIKCLKRGIVQLTLTCSEDKTVKKILTINFI